MTAKKDATKPTWHDPDDVYDPDDAPELTDEWFQMADQRVNGVLVKRGRRPLESPKKAISLRVDADVLDRFKAEGPGWQSRMNDALRKAAGL